MYSISVRFHFLILHLNNTEKCWKQSKKKKIITFYFSVDNLQNPRFPLNKFNFFYCTQSLLYLARNLTKWYLSSTFKIADLKINSRFTKHNVAIGFLSLSKHFQVTSQMSGLNLKEINTILSLNHFACQVDRTKCLSFWRNLKVLCENSPLFKSINPDVITNCSIWASKISYSCILILQWLEQNSRNHLETKNKNKQTK